MSEMFDVPSGCAGNVNTSGQLTSAHSQNMGKLIFDFCGYLRVLPDFWLEID